MICVVIDAAVGAVDVVIAVITAVIIADAAGAGAPARMTGIITGGRYGTRAQGSGGRLTAQVLTTDTGLVTKTGDGIGVPGTDKEGTD